MKGTLLNITYDNKDNMGIAITNVPCHKAQPLKIGHFIISNNVANGISNINPNAVHIVINIPSFIYLIHITIKVTGPEKASETPLLRVRAGLKNLRC